MEDIQTPVPANYCTNCHEKEILPGYPMALCEDCRDTFNRYPIPKWIWAFAAGIGLLMVYGLIRMPPYVEACIHLRRAEKAIEQHKYITAEAEADKVSAHFPDLLEANTFSFIAAGYNGNREKMISIYDKIKNENIEDTALYHKIEAAMSFEGEMNPADTSLYQKIDSISLLSVSEQEHCLDAIGHSIVETDKPILGVSVAANLYKEKAYKESITLLNKVLKIAPDYYSAVYLLIGAKKNFGDYAGASALCDDMLKKYPEDVKIIVQKAALALKLKQDKEAAVLAKQALLLDPHSPGALEVQAIVYYYADKKEESNKLLVQISKLEGEDTTVTARLRKVLNGTDSYR